MFKEKARPNYSVEFTASSEWFKQRNHYSLYNMKMSSESGSANVNAAEEFLEIG